MAARAAGEPRQLDGKGAKLARIVQKTHPAKLPNSETVGVGLRVLGRWKRVMSAFVREPPLRDEAREASGHVGIDDDDRLPCDIMARNPDILESSVQVDGYRLTSIRRTTHRHAANIHFVHRADDLSTRCGG